MTSVWLQRFYYVFGFLALVLLILIITCAEISIVLCYFQLCNEDYNWWWRAFLTSGSSGLYLFVYSIVYMSTKMVMTRGVSILLYVGYMLIASYSFFMLTGAVGFLFLQQATSGHHADFQLSELQRQVAEHHQLLHAHIGRGSEPPRKPPKVPGCLRWILD
mmetsp:Transcript_17257/g.56134  ORF Transcript_17257/g.56134 Transcript_17257/m.56134 type:complete len:161 (-) Transcript_17257:333-815(-)